MDYRQVMGMWLQSWLLLLMGLQCAASSARVQSCDIGADGGTDGSTDRCSKCFAIRRAHSCSQCIPVKCTNSSSISLAYR